MTTETPQAPAPKPSVSVFRKRLKKFRTLKRGYYSFLALLALYVLSFFLFVIVNNRAIVVCYNGEYSYPAFNNRYYAAGDFGQKGEFFTEGVAPANFRLLDARCEAENGDNWVWMPIVPYDAYEFAQIHIEAKILAQYAAGDFSADAPPVKEPEPKDEGAPNLMEEGEDGLYEEGEDGLFDEGEDGYFDEGEDGAYDEGEDGAPAGAGEEKGDDEGDDSYDLTDLDAVKAMTPPFEPSWDNHWLGTDDRGRSLIARLAYGFRISITFAVILCFVSYTVGVSFGAVLGYYGGTVDLFGQRIIEVWQTIPFLFTVMILGSALDQMRVLDYKPGVNDLLQPRFLMLVVVLAVFSWMGITYFIRGEFFREKSRDYVSAAISIGTRDRTIIFKHILPNALTPVVTFAPFTIVGNISALVALDFLGFGLPAPTPSWGELMKQVSTEINTAGWTLILSPILALFFTLLLVVFIGEAVREAFDPKVFSRLR